MSRRMSPRPGRRGGARWWIAAGGLVGVAAGLTYLFDPDEGRTRRARMAQRSTHVARRIGRATVRRAQYVSSSATSRLRHRLTGAHPALVEGRTLLDRVESELFADHTIPHGKLNLEVEGTTVVLRGQLDSYQEIDRVEAAVRRIPGVREVKNLLHLPGTPAPNKLAALMASADATPEERWPDEPPPDVDSETAATSNEDV
jgi:hypothetical protein